MQAQRSLLKLWAVAGLRREMIMEGALGFVGQGGVGSNRNIVDGVGFSWDSFLDLYSCPSTVHDCIHGNRSRIT